MTHFPIKLVIKEMKKRNMLETKTRITASYKAEFKQV